MKKKFALLNILLLFSVLFSMLFQSLHSYEHLAKEFSKKHCQHHYQIDKTEVSHQHNDFDDCFACEFTVSSYISPSVFSYDPPNKHVKKPYFYSLFSSQKTLVESSNLLRGPPTI
jgi:hypothetical protein